MPKNLNLLVRLGTISCLFSKTTALPLVVRVLYDVSRTWSVKWVKPGDCKEEWAEPWEVTRLPSIWQCHKYLMYMYVVCVCVACAWGVNKRRRRILESKGLKSECITYMYNFYFAWVGGGAAPLALWIPSIWNGKSFIQLSMLSCFKAATGTQKGSGSGKMTVLRFFSLPDPSRLKKMTPPYIYLLGSFPKCASKCLR